MGSRRNLAPVRDHLGRDLPAPLVVAASLAGLEGLLVLAYAVVLADDIHSDRVTMGVTTSLFFALLAGLLVCCAWYVARGRTWARSPIVVVQVMALGLAWNFLGGSTTWISVALAVVAVVVLVGLLLPASIEALSDERDPTS
jgi:peptidoglycan/LPS O-acetylase OafA/YrhL